MIWITYFTLICVQQLEVKAFVVKLTTAENNGSLLDARRERLVCVREMLSSKRGELKN